VIGVLIPSFVLAEADGITLRKQEKYLQSIRIVAKKLKTRPDDPTLNYCMGRCFLALNKAGKAIGYLKKAAELVPDRPDHQFWLGVGYWANMEFNKEKQSYLKALKLDPEHVSANLYLGHNYMDRNQWKAALNQYDRVLAINPSVPDALYNRALVFRHLGKKSDEKNAWKSYLDRYRIGKLAIQAAEQLNGYGDFSYRIYLLGSRRIVVPAINFESAGSTLKTESVLAFERIGNILTKNRALSVHVIAYMKDNPKTARSRVKVIKRYILGTFPEIEPSRIMVSWFGVPEKIASGNGRYVFDESVNIVTRTGNK
jgi:tetratricopeptide (TPR) repeat protein